MAGGLSAGSPILPTYITDVQVLQILGVILDIYHILLCAAAVGFTVVAWTLHRLQMR